MTNEELRKWADDMNPHSDDWLLSRAVLRLLDENTQLIEDRRELKLKSVTDDASIALLSDENTKLRTEKDKLKHENQRLSIHFGDAMRKERKLLEEINSIKTELENEVKIILTSLDRLK